MSTDVPAASPTAESTLPPAPGHDPDLLAALRADLTAADYTVDVVEELMGPLAADALRRENPWPARASLADSEHPAADLAAFFTLGVPLPAARLDELLPALRCAGAERLGLLGPARAVGGDGQTAGGGGQDTARTEGSGGQDTALVSALVDLSAYSATDDLGAIHWWIASDLSELSTGRALHGEHVLGVGGASLTLARLTPREHVSRVLDLGCGGGIQAMHASRHADTVVATDLSQRALAFASFNAALNGITLDLRQGSLLEPVAGERFDLIVSNPPFVITPRSTSEEAWTYRDGGRAGDDLLAELLTALPEHLHEDGRAVMLANWEIAADGAQPQDAPAPQATDPAHPDSAHPDSAQPDPALPAVIPAVIPLTAEHPAWAAHPAAWLQPAIEDGVDAWVIQRETEDPAQYAETWARDGGITPRDERWPGMIQSWLADFASRGVDRIGFGYVLLRRRPQGTHGVLRCEEQPGTGSGTLATHLATALRDIGTLADLDDDALWDSRPVRADDVVERRHLTPGAWDPTLIELVQGAGFARTVPADTLLAATVGALDGTLTLGQVLTAVCALTGDDADAARERTLPRIRELVIGGMLRL